MLDAFVPFLLLIVAPLAYFGLRATDSPWLRGALLCALAALVATRTPTSGLTIVELRQATLVVNASIVLLLAARWSSDDRRPSARGRFAWLGLTAIAAVAVYVNFFRFHGPTTGFVHAHEFAHYYLGSKYARELGYADLYAAMLTAEADDGPLTQSRARDLATNEIVAATSLVAAGQAARARFTPERWQAFREDAREFRRRLGDEYAKVLIDHGYNPSPVWTLIGGTIANTNRASDRTFLFLGLLDVLILACVSLAVWRVFGAETVALSVIYFSTAFGTEFPWVGGGYLRQMWFGALVGFALCMDRGRYASAGALLGFATALRVFPVFFAVPIGGRAVRSMMQTRRLAPEYRRFFVAFVSMSLALVALSGSMLGWPMWQGFFDNTALHANRTGFNVLGLTQASAWFFDAGLSSASEAQWLERVAAWRDSFYTVQLLFVFLPLTIFVSWVSSRMSDLEAAGMAAVMILCGLNISAYYSIFMTLLVIVFRNDVRALAWFFGAELAVHVIHLFEPREEMLYLYKTNLLLYALTAVYWPLVRSPKSRAAAPAT